MLLGFLTRNLGFLSSWCLLSIVGYGGVHAATPIAYGSFVKSATYSIANQLGYFADEGLDVTYHQVPNSSFAYDGLLAGTYDILTGTIDNAYGTDYSFQIVGGTPFRYQALLDGHLSNGSVAYATVLTYPYTAYLTRDANTSVSSGPHILARVSDFIAPFPSQALTVRTSTIANANTPAYRAAVSFVRAMLRANRLLAIPDPHQRASVKVDGRIQRPQVVGDVERALDDVVDLDMLVVAWIQGLQLKTSAPFALLLPGRG
ncbi:hypothetical protein PG996_010897 [Apiospora saccharicola]|uniref:SsuA/THI5-like domain-containing protein n=1 Tax=Apiospora saccharicola TaxID=335842 RepID=A0ABR1UQJ5_9PEZI